MPNAELEHVTPLVNVSVTLLAVVLPPYVTGLVPLNEQKAFSFAHLTSEPAGVGVGAGVPVVGPYQQLFV
ncbi:hypothetical protein [Paraburkholderia phenazinium]|uniref:hypothetical protein n=1 Tax=Paraburkholderia phenazinium TaxID=60549 RepID=UPI001C40AED8|nr:hypothetical protein [Paraburkholderia phenazinium]